MGSNRPRFPLYLHLTLCQVSVILGCFGVLGYLVYGSNVPQIVTDTLTQDIFSQFIRVTLMIAVLFTYPLQLIPVIRITESLVFGKRGRKKKSHLSELVAGHSGSFTRKDEDDEEDDQSVNYSSNTIQEESQEDRSKEGAPLCHEDMEDLVDMPFIYKVQSYSQIAIALMWKIILA